MLDINQISDQRYIPTSVEIKRALLMYLFVWIMIQISKTQLTIYEYQHLKQSLGWFVVVMIFVWITVPLWFIPYGPLVIAVVWMGLFAYVWWLMYRAYQWHYSSQNEFLSSIGTWMLTIFDHTVEVTHI